MFIFNRQYPMLLTNALYINLDSRQDRLALITRQLHSIGVPSPERVAGVRTETGAVGCTMSHIRCLEIARARNWSHVCIFEDDFKCINPEKFKSSLAKFEQNHEADGFANWSVLMLGGNNHPPYTVFPDVDYCIRVGKACSSLVGYVVKQHMYDTLIANFKEGVNLLIRHPTMLSSYAVDMYCVKLQQDGTWYLLTPLTVTQQSGYSNIEHRVINYDRLMLDIDKGWLMSPQHAEMIANQTTKYTNA
jgi:glycosyl transferase family 25